MVYPRYSPLLKEVWIYIVAVLAIGGSDMAMFWFAKEFLLPHYAKHFLVVYRDTFTMQLNSDSAIPITTELLYYFFMAFDRLFSDDFLSYRATKNNPAITKIKPKTCTMVSVSFSKRTEMMVAVTNIRLVISGKAIVRLNRCNTIL